MPQALILIVAAITQDASIIQKALRDVAYYQKTNTKAYQSHKKKRAAEKSKKLRDIKMIS
jgi:hypothetical protein